MHVGDFRQPDLCKLIFTVDFYSLQVFSICELGEAVTCGHEGLLIFHLLQMAVFGSFSFSCVELFRGPNIL